jgi:large subunit ribosomal protein L24
MKAIRRNDTVLVIAGKDRGKTGVVRSVLVKKGRVVVDGVNMIKKHQRPSQSQGQMVPGGIVTREGPLDASNVMIVCSECSKAVRTGARIRPDGVKVRVCKKCGADID